tara:strand:- start:76546 stop:77583 length:1038 start_codon:yes stop_codon:yes gene_type:complete
MMLPAILTICISIMLFSGLIIYLIRQYSIRKDLFDVPNNRSSHTTPTPKGGGIGIVLTLLITISALFAYDMIESNLALSLLLGLSIVAITGLIDDFKNISALKRALTYVISALLSIYLIGGFTTVSINNYTLQLSHAGYLFSVLFVVWLINLYNFMDGTDGFAAIQTIMVSLFCGYLFMTAENIPFTILILGLFSSTLAFLYWNWSPAKIFMGDVGSCSIGFLFGLLTIYTEAKNIISISVWLILLAPFIGDATYTLFKRILNREKWYQAHNSHAYQRFYQSGFTHSQLAIGLFMINLLIVWPCATIANFDKSLELAMLILVYSLIGTLWLLGQKNYFIAKTKSV